VAEPPVGEVAHAARELLRLVGQLRQGLGEPVADRDVPLTSRGFQLNWVGRFGASQGLQLINTRSIPNSALLPFFLLCCVMCVALCRRKQVVPRDWWCSGLGVTTWLRMLRGQALSVGLAV
jgi:hypothetical protein